MVLDAVNEVGTCDKASKLAGGGSFYYATKAERLGATVGAEAAGVAVKLSRRFAAVGIILGLADGFGLC